MKRSNKGRAISSLRLMLQLIGLVTGVNLVAQKSDTRYVGSTEAETT
jgi:hypothetical protein